MKTYSAFELAEAYKQYGKCRIVAEKFGCSDETVRRALIEYDVPRVKRHPRPVTRPRATEHELIQIVNEYYFDGVTISDLSKKYRRSPHTISNAISLYGSGLKHSSCNSQKISDAELADACKTMTRREIASKYGMHVATIDNRMRKLGIHAVYATPQERPKKPKRTMALDEYRAKVRLAAETRKQQKEIEKAKYVKEHTIIRACVICGAGFELLDTETRMTCSARCSKKYANKKRERRIPKSQRVDFISLERLYMRDKGKCYLCGRVCDWSDWSISPKGHQYPGCGYPTIEHVLPISKGGLDAWDNVRLACWKCNLEKADAVVDAHSMSKEFAYSQAYSKTTRKRTAQYSLDGELIKVWESTAQIRKELGFNDSHIQNVCRRSGSSTGNAYGYHWEYVDDAAKKGVS